MPSIRALFKRFVIAILVLFKKPFETDVAPDFQSDLVALKQQQKSGNPSAGVSKRVDAEKIEVGCRHQYQKRYSTIKNSIVPEQNQVSNSTNTPEDFIQDRCDIGGHIRPLFPKAEQRHVWGNACKIYRKTIRTSGRFSSDGFFGKYKHASRSSGQTREPARGAYDCHGHSVVNGASINARPVYKLQRGNFELRLEFQKRSGGVGFAFFRLDQKERFPALRH